jgi:branched-chain amino acid aminotransferase
MAFPILINLNGKLCTPQEAKVSVYDRSYLYGDSLYEVARSYDGKFYKLREHLVRLVQSAKLCHMKLDQSIEQYQAEIESSYKAWKALPGADKYEAYCRIVVSRGEGKIGFGLSNLTSPSLYTILLEPVEPPTADQVQRGHSLQVARRIRNDRRALDPAMKSGNYLNSLLAYLEATSQGDFNDALLCNSEGHVTEGTTFNIFYARRGIIATPPLDIGILDGITRRLVIDIARAKGYEVREIRFPKERLYEADEVFMSSSVKECYPVTRVDHVKIGNGKPGPITLELRQAYKDAIPHHG